MFLAVSSQVDNDFILPLEREMFIELLKDIVDKAEDLLSEDTEGERTSDQGGSPKQGEGVGPLGTEVRSDSSVFLGFFIPHNSYQDLHCSLLLLNLLCDPC